MPDLWLRLSFISFERLIFSGLGKVGMGGEWEVNGINYLSACMGIHGGIFGRRDGMLVSGAGGIRVEPGQ